MFYAGHGIETDGVNYVVPEDALASGAPGAGRVRVGP